MKKRMISFALVLAMILSMTTVVFASETKDWESEIDTLGVAVVNGTYYHTVQAAVDAANGATVKLLEDSTEAVEATGNVYLNLDGHSLKSLKTSGTLYGIDTASDKFVDSGAKIETVEGKVEPYYANANKYYMAVTEGDGVSFHRFRFRITHISLSPSSVGFGYRADFEGDAKVQGQVKEIAYTLWLTDGNEVTRAQEGFQETVRLRLYNYRVNEYGETPVHAKVVVTLENGAKFESEDEAYSMRTMLEMVEETFEALTVAQKKAINAMCKEFDAVNAWNITKILGWTE